MRECGENNLGKIKKIKYRMRERKNNFLKKYYRIEGKIKYPLIYSLNSFIRLIDIGIVLFITLTLLHQLKVLNLEWLEKNVLNHLPGITKELNRQFLFSQISVTFIILSLFSLIINLKKEKVLGTSIYKIAFAKSILGNIIFISISIFLFLFINITLYINDNSSEVILYVFLIALFLLTLLIIKIILYSNSQKLSINKIASIYYWENTKLIRNPRKFGSKERYSEYLYNLNEDTIEKILRRDVEYKRNLYVYQRIANLSLANYKNKVQENYTEIIKEPDIISMWASSVEELIKNELYADSLNQYNTMINLFIHHEVYISSFEINQLLEQIFISISAIESKVMFEQNKELLLNSMKLTMKYGYYKLNNDFSYTRLGKLKHMLYLKPLYSGFMIDYYNLIDKNKNYNDLERSKRVFEYFESLRMMSFDITTYFPRELKYHEVRRELTEYNEELSLVGIPLSNLLILIVQEDKKGRLLYFLNNYNNDSIYFACLIVASKLSTLYFQIKDDDRSNKKIIEDYLVLILAKLIELDDKKIKYFCYTIKQTMDFNTNSLYDHIYLSPKNAELLNIVKQTIMIKKKRIDIKNKSFSDRKLSEIVNLFYTRYNSNLLKKEQEEDYQKLNDKFGLLMRLL
ncbi:hypothetical protein [Peribacillus frigoritolerans]|uniref:hypothetical protein n=1 Tax=Peribacillus frigoritolerans TaxID=450367 RepID=UPI0024C18BEA|nr:hypothetical protein [Peribacillus frigoritolerans]WHX62350.1 hypothetical protein QNH33_01690 [Peribacillus frigoritolerans]